MTNTREKLIELFREIYSKIMVVSFDELADHLIANDVVPVVRCKDCVSGHKQYYGGLFRCNVMGCGGLKPDDFCSCGERRYGE